MSGCWANGGSVPVSYYRCNDCGLTGLTGEFWLPSNTSMTSLDSDRRLTNRMAKRRSRGILWRVEDTRKGRRMTDDRIEAIIRIIPGKVQRGLAKRIERLRRKRSQPLDTGTTTTDTDDPPS